MSDLLLHDYTKKLLDDQLDEVEKRLKAMGLTPKDLSKRCYVMHDPNDSSGMIYYFDNKPVVRTYLKREGYTITAVVESL